MGRELSLFIGTFTTLLAIINPLEVLPVYLKLLEGKDVKTHRQVAWKACVYALLLSLFFLIFGTLILRLFGVPLAMVRIVGDIILMKIGFVPPLPPEVDQSTSPAGIALVIRLIPPEIMAQHRDMAIAAQDRPVSRVAGVPIVTICIVGIALTLWISMRFFGDECPRYWHKADMGECTAHVRVRW